MPIPFDVSILQSIREHNPSLISVELKHNRFDKSNAKQLCDALRSNMTIKLLSISKCDFSSYLKDLNIALLNNVTLITLNLNDNGITDDGVLDLSAVLVSNKTLQTLDVSMNGIGVVGAGCLGYILDSNASLKVLNLQDNNIGDAGTKHLSSKLQSNHFLQSINLSNNLIGDNGVIDFSHALKINTSLRSIALHFNRISEVGAEHLAAALMTNNSLQSIDLSLNSIGDGGAIHLAHALRVNKTIRSFNLCDNRIGAVGANAIAEALAANFTLTELHGINHPNVIACLKRNRAMQLATPLTDVQMLEERVADEKIAGLPPSERPDQLKDQGPKKSFESVFKAKRKKEKSARGSETLVSSEGMFFSIRQSSRIKQMKKKQEKSTAGKPAPAQESFFSISKRTQPKMSQVADPEPETMTSSQ